MPLLILLLSGLIAYHRIVAEASTGAANSAMALAAHAKLVIKSQELLIDAAATGSAERSWGASSTALSGFLQRTVKRGNGAAEISLMGPDGQKSFSTAPSPASGLTAGDKAGFAAARADDALHFSAVSLDDGSATFNIARRLAGPGGAVLVITIDPAHFSAPFNALELTGADSLDLTRADGELLFRMPPRGGADAVIAQTAGGNLPTGLYRDKDVDGILALQQLGDYPLYATYAHPRSVIWAQWLLVMSSFATVALCVAVALLVASMLARRRVQHALAAAAALAHESARQSAAEEISRSRDDFLTALNHELRSPLSAIAASVEDQDEDRQKAREAGFDGHLTKPVSYAELQFALQ